MPATRVRIAQFRGVWWKRPSMIGGAGGVVLVVCLAFAGWASLAPRASLAQGVETSPEPVPELRSFVRSRADARTLAAIAQNNPLSASRTDFTREVAVAEAEEVQDTGERDRLKRLEDAKSALSTLRLVAILRLSDQWIALFEPSVRRAEDDLLSLRVGNEWEGWKITSIERSEVRLGFEGHTETVKLNPLAQSAKAKDPPRGRLQVETRPLKGHEVKIDPAISKSEVRQRLLGAAREESERVRKLAEELLKELDKENK
jgi:hypothetical protein